LGSVSNGGTYRKNGDHEIALMSLGRAVLTNQSKLSQIAIKLCFDRLSWSQQSI
jgi:hypothetical protein